LVRLFQIIARGLDRCVVWGFWGFVLVFLFVFCVVWGEGATSFNISLGLCPSLCVDVKNTSVLPTPAVLAVSSIGPFLAWRLFVFLLLDIICLVRIHFLFPPPPGNLSSLLRNDTFNSFFCLWSKWILFGA